MKIKSMSGILAVAVAVMGMSSPAMADYNCDEKDLSGDYVLSLDDRIQCHAEALTCEQYTDSNGDDAIRWTHTDGIERGFSIWQKQSGKLKNAGDLEYSLSGCEVHLSLAQQLYVPHPVDEPPIFKKNGKGNSQAVAKGAANDLRDGKLDSAIQHLCNFRNTIESVAWPNERYLGVTPGLAFDQQVVAEGWLGELGVTDILETCYAY
jgi:hypothetical protein